MSKVSNAAKMAKERSADLVSQIKAKGGRMLQEEKFIFETLEDPATVRQYLLDVIDGLDKGRVILTNGDDEMVFYPGNLLKFSLRGKRKPGKSRLSLSISWSRLEEDQ